MIKITVPLPPLAEQRRIVAKVDELMALCDGLEESLTAADNTRHRLLEALLAEALSPVLTIDRRGGGVTRYGCLLVVFPRSVNLG